MKSLTEKEILCPECNNMCCIKYGCPWLLISEYFVYCVCVCVCVCVRACVSASVCVCVCVCVLSLIHI